MSPMPKPMHPLKKNKPNAPPPKPRPTVWDQTASNAAETHSRQKFAVVPPSARVARLANTTESENRTVARKAGNIIQLLHSGTRIMGAENGRKGRVCQSGRRSATFEP